MFNVLFNEVGTSLNGANAVINTVLAEADNCLIAPEGINFENKIVLSIAIRLTGEKFMVTKINNPIGVAAISSNQTHKLLSMYKLLFATDRVGIETMERVALMTPENIHLNSFMYEPILDMSDDHLRKLYSDVKAL